MNTKKEGSTIDDKIDNFFFCNVGAKTKYKAKSIQQKKKQKKNTSQIIEKKKQIKIDLNNTVVKESNLFQSNNLWKKYKKIICIGS